MMPTTELLFGNALVAVFVAWLAVSGVTGVWALRYFADREPAGWHYNDTQAYALPRGRMSFYANFEKRALILKAHPLLPVLWRVYEVQGYSRAGLEVTKRGPVWKIVPYAYNHMENLSVLASFEEAGA